MTKLLQNKPLIKFLGIALSILLVVALVPQISIAYGSKDDIADETALAETGENAATEGEEVAADGEGDATPGEAPILPRVTRLSKARSLPSTASRWCPIK